MKLFKDRKNEVEVETIQNAMLTLQVTLYTASMEYFHLTHLVFMGSFEEVSQDVTIASLGRENKK